MRKYLYLAIAIGVLTSIDSVQAQSCPTEPFAYDVRPGAAGNTECRISMTVDDMRGWVDGVMTCPGVEEHGDVRGAYYPDGGDCMLRLRWSYPSVRPGTGDEMGQLQYRSTVTGILFGVQTDAEACNRLSEVSPDGYLSIGDILVSTEIWREGGVTDPAAYWQDNLRCRYSVRDWIGNPTTRLGKGSINCLGGGLPCGENPRLDVPQTVQGLWKLAPPDQWSPVGEAKITTGGDWVGEYATVPLEDTDVE